MLFVTAPTTAIEDILASVLECADRVADDLRQSARARDNGTSHDEIELVRRNLRPVGTVS